MGNTSQKPGTMLYFSLWYAPLEILDGEQVKELLRDVLNLAENGEYPDSFSDRLVEVFFKQMVTTIIHDDEQYRRKVEQCRKAGQASVNARQRLLTVANDCQRLLTNTNQYQFNKNQANTDQHSSTETNSKYWGDNKLWEERCEKLDVDPYDPKQKEEFDKSWRIEENEKIIPF